MLTQEGLTLTVFKESHTYRRLRAAPSSPGNGANLRSPALVARTSYHNPPPLEPSVLITALATS